MIVAVIVEVLEVGVTVVLGVVVVEVVEDVVVVEVVANCGMFDGNIVIYWL